MSCAQVEGEPVERHEEGVGDAGADRRRVVALVGLAELLPEVVDAG